MGDGCNQGNIAFYGLLAIAVLGPVVVRWIKMTYVRKKIRDATTNFDKLSPREFFKIRNTSLGGRGKPHYSNNYEFKGVYVLHNVSKDKYYVGQSQNVMNRVNSHLTGKGNGSVYADYKYGDEFEIVMVPLKNSGYRSLNKLESVTIDAFGAYKKGYNKTKGNK